MWVLMKMIHGTFTPAVFSTPLASVLTWWQKATLLLRDRTLWICIWCEYVWPPQGAGPVSHDSGKQSWNPTTSKCNNYISHEPLVRSSGSWELLIKPSLCIYYNAFTWRWSVWIYSYYPIECCFFQIFPVSIYVFRTEFCWRKPTNEWRLSWEGRGFCSPQVSGGRGLWWINDGGVITCSLQAPPTCSSSHNNNLSNVGLFPAQVWRGAPPPPPPAGVHTNSALFLLLLLFLFLSSHHLHQQLGGARRLPQTVHSLHRVLGVVVARHLQDRHIVTAIRKWPTLKLDELQTFDLFYSTAFIQEVQHVPTFIKNLREFLSEHLTVTVITAAVDLWPLKWPDCSFLLRRSRSESVGSLWSAARLCTKPPLGPGNLETSSSLLIRRHKSKVTSWQNHRLNKNPTELDFMLQHVM